MLAVYSLGGAGVSPDSVLGPDSLIPIPASHGLVCRVGRSGREETEVRVTETGTEPGGSRDLGQQKLLSLEGWEQRNKEREGLFSCLFVFETGFLCVALAVLELDL